ncbi:exo-beta-1,4-galactosidase [Tellurirhabdus rosea]|uniref:exo-beta-1,4-galactosidase n=1 Tax=Tellurirhabdus rosea TaxID=2674997 RepID=UPI0022507940|nr:sugar-binding domain-containing protein [Tellurirhabdus rosea]
MIEVTSYPSLPGKYLTGLLFLLLISAKTLAGPIIDLKGTWRFRTDPADKGIPERWFATRLPETIKLPGSMLENGKGDPVTLQTKWTGSIYDSSWYFNPRMEKYRRPDNLKFPFWLTPDKYYAGAAWYQKDVTIPQNWRGKRVVLFLERSHTETRVWVDQQEIGKQNSLSVAHEYDLTAALSPGKHTLTIRIDNRLEVINVGKDSHSVTDHTQGNWNGIVGRLELRATEPVWFEDVQVYPDLTRKSARVKMTLHNTTGKPVLGRIQVAAVSFNSSVKQSVKPLTIEYGMEGKEAVVEADYPMGEAPLLWDEFNPALYRLTASLTTADQRKEARTVTFGMREFGIRGTRFTLNGREIFLRGTVENCQFPLTGYAPMDVAGWERVFRIAKRYGLNHMRYHSFCPPEAAFVAADLVGFYLQPEGPSWANHGTSLGDGRPVDQYIYDETARMAKAYGNYASFVMLAYGNEPAGRNQVKYLTEFVHYWQKKDPRRKYTGASVGNSWPLVPENEFMVKAGARNLPWDKRPESTGDYRDKIEPFKVPYVAHELGQWCVFPNFREISKYRGVYKAKNFELFREDLADRGMGEQGHDFLMASGKLQLLSYKNEIERALRTPGMAGFQLLSLNDYSGQGTALVGLLDAFWEEKGYVTEKEFARFCAPTVPLARLPKFVFQSNESLHAELELSHFGNVPIPSAVTRWTLTDEAGKALAQGSFGPKPLAIGSNVRVGEINVPLSGVQKATRLKLTVSVAGTKAANDWEIWVYPTTVAAEPTNVLITTSLDEKAEQTLKSGGCVLLLAAGKIEKGKEVAQHFLPAFWNTSWFKMRPPHTLGILLNPKHPAFADFPTDYHSNLQWWELVNRTQVMNLEDFPAHFRPLVQPIDTWFLNRRLGLVLEANVGGGRLVVSSADLSSDLENRPAARQLRQSLLNYMASEAFRPKGEVAASVIRALFTEPSRDTYKPFTKDAPDELKVKNQQP